MKKTKLTQDYLPGYDLLRIMATFAVIILHVSTLNLGSSALGSGDWTAMMVWDGAVRWSVPLFFMISGALFLQSDKPYRQILFKNALRILTAFLFWSLIYTIVAHPTGWKTFIFTWLSGHYHMWFCYAILGIYLVIPILRHIVKDEKVTKIFMIFWFVFASLIPFAVFITWLVSPTFSNLINTVNSKIDLLLPMGYTGAFMLGYCLRNIPPKMKRLLYFSGILGLVITPLSAVLASLKYGRPITSLYPYLMPNVILPAAALFVLLKDIRIRKEGLKRFLRILADASFGTYLMHVLVLDLMTHLGFSPLLFSPWISVPVIAIACAVISFAISALIRRIPFVGKIIS